MTKMEVNQNGKQPKWISSKIEDKQNARRPIFKLTKIDCKQSISYTSKKHIKYRGWIIIFWAHRPG